MAATDLISRGRGSAMAITFRVLADPHRRELLVYCYRMPVSARWPVTSSR